VNAGRGQGGTSVAAPLVGSVHREVFMRPLRFTVVAMVVSLAATAFLATPAHAQTGNNIGNRLQNWLYNNWSGAYNTPYYWQNWSNRPNTAYNTYSPYRAYSPYSNWNGQTGGYYGNYPYYNSTRSYPWGWYR
jgi:hypothetical protein